MQNESRFYVGVLLLDTFKPKNQHGSCWINLNVSVMFVVIIIAVVVLCGHVNIISNGVIDYKFMRRSEMCQKTAK